MADSAVAPDTLLLPKLRHSILPLLFKSHKPFLTQIMLQLHQLPLLGRHQSPLQFNLHILDGFLETLDVASVFRKDTVLLAAEAVDAERGRVDEDRVRDADVAATILTAGVGDVAGFGDVVFAAVAALGVVVGNADAHGCLCLGVK